MLTALPWILVVVAGAMAGSVVDVLVTRIPEGKPIAWARSQCQSCGHTLGVLDLIPLASWLVLKGHCRHCGALIGPRPVVLEISAILIAVMSMALLNHDPILYLATVIFGWTLLALSAIDMRTQCLPDSLTVFLGVSGLITTQVLFPHTMIDHLLGALLGGGSFWALAKTYHLLRGREGLGLGDVKLMAALGTWISWQGLPSLVLMAALIGIAATLIRSVLDREKPLTAPIAFGPCLCLSGWVVWLGVLG